MRFHLLTTAFMALTVLAAPIQQPSEGQLVRAAHAAGDALKSAIPRLEAAITAKPELGRLITGDDPSSTTAGALNSLSSLASSLGSATGATDLTSALTTGLSLGGKLGMGIFDGVTGILGAEYNGISSIFSYLWSWVPGLPSY